MDRRKENEDFYRRIRKRLVKWQGRREAKQYQFIDFLLAAPDLFHLLCKLSADPKVPSKVKAKLAMGILYFISPVDIIPELITGPIGYSDDVVVAAFILNFVMSHVDEETIKKHWAGNQNIMELIQNILKVGRRFVGVGNFSMIKNLFK